MWIVDADCGWCKNELVFTPLITMYCDCEIRSDNHTNRDKAVSANKSSASACKKN